MIYKHLKRRTEMESQYPKTKEYIEELYARKITYFDRQHKANIIDLLVKEDNTDLYNELFCDLDRLDIESILSFLKDLNSVNCILTRSMLIDRAYESIRYKIENIIDDVIMENSVDLSEEL